MPVLAFDELGVDLLINNVGPVFMSALISKDRDYRYMLSRAWEPEGRLAMWIMLNPSTADHVTNDSTIKKCMKFSRRFGCGGMDVLNLFAYRSPTPDVLKKVADPIGPTNDEAIVTMLEMEAEDHELLVIAAWGNGGTYKNRAAHVTQLVTGLGFPIMCLRLSNTGQPWHPLYVPDETNLSMYRDAQ